MPPRTRATPSRKKQTTARAFLFSDLRDYTSYVEAKGDAAAARLLREYRTLVRREVARHEGAEVKTEGDSFYVVFESASSALECAVGILRAADTRSAKDPSAPLRIGVGLHAGETVEYDDQFVGSAVNIASRLAGKAGAMELLISDTLRGLVRTSQSLAMTERGALDLKGVAEKIRAWSVEWREPEPVISGAPPAAMPGVARQRTAPPTGQLLCPVVVGRRAERERFAAALAAATGGSGQTVVLGGEAGVGKSAFVRDAQDRALAAGCRVLVGLTLQADAGLPYGPFVSAVRSGFRGLDRDELGRVLRHSAPDLAELFPELGRTERAEAPSSLERHRLSVAFQHLLRAFAREAPLLVVLEDLHWADETSLELLQHLARELRDERALILATYRSDEMHRRHPFLRVLAELQRERLVTEIALRRLTPDETKELIRETFAASDPDISVSDEFRDAIYARSEGSPFFTEELLKALVESGGIYFRTDTGWGRKPIAELEIPGSIREAVRTRVDRLSSEARETLSAASVIGQRFSFDLLRTVRGVEERVIETHVREFIELQLVVEAGDEGAETDEYAFRHALTREVVYDDLLVRERKRLHRAVSAALGDAAEPSLLAHHLLAAGEADRAVPNLLEAARRAFRASAPREAVAHVARALEVGVPDDGLAAALELQAEAYHFFDAALSLKAAVEAAEAYRERGDPRGRSRMLRLASRSHWLRGEGAEAQALAREALDVLAGEPESMGLGRATAHLAGLRMVDNANEEAVTLGDQAIAIGERTKDPWTIANALISKGSAIGRSDGPAGLALVRQGTALAKREGLIDAASRGLNNSVLWSSIIGLPRPEIRREIEAALAWSRAHGLERAGMAYLNNQLAWVTAADGDLAGARAILDEIHAAGVRVGHVFAFLLDTLRDGPAASLARVDEVLATGQRAMDAQHYVPSQMTAAAVRILGGRREDAALQYERARDEIAATGRGAELLAGPWAALALLTAYALDMPGWIEFVRSDHVAPTDDLRESRVKLVASVDALGRGDHETAAREFTAHLSLMPQFAVEPLYTLCVLLVASEARRRGVAPTPGWRALAARLRAWAEKAGAVWAAAELAEIEAGS